MLTTACLLATLSLAPHDDVLVLEEYALTLDLTALEGVQSEPRGLGNQLVARCAGTLGRSSVEMSLTVLSAEDYRLREPSDVTTVIARHRSRGDSATRFRWETVRGLPGPFGWASYGWLGHATLMQETKPRADVYCLGGLLPTVGYALEVECEPPLDDASREQLEAWFASGITWEGEPRNHRWSDEEVEERWQRQAPDKVLEDSKLHVVRTDYYLVLTNVGKGTAKSFGEKMDEVHEAIRELYPFEAVKGQRLLPIYYFVQPDQYYDWCVKNLSWNEQQARRSKGVASGDVYATYHQATNDPVHPHEATHQVFRNRLQLSGGGSWFQEGVAEYFERNPNDLSGIKGLAKRGKLMPLERFFVIPSLLQSSDAKRTDGTNEASDNYAQAAAVIEFVRHSKPTKDKFYEFIEAIGQLPRGDLPRIEDTLVRLFGTDVEAFDALFNEYWKKRKKPRSK